MSFIRNSMDKIKHKYKNDEIYLVRNERNLAIYDFKDGARFEPDFVLFLKDHNFSYQIFIEPKGKGWREKDEWKEEFLKTIKDKFIIDDENFRLIGLKFYTKEIENEFEEEFRNELSI